MIKFRGLAVAGLAILMITACSPARSTFKEAQELEAKGFYEEAMFRYAEAFKADPEVVEYRLRFLSARQSAGQKREKQGDELLVAGSYADAVTAYQTAAGLDAGQPRYSQKAASAARQRDAAAAWQEGLDFKKSNKLREAAAAFDRALQLAPENAAYLATAQWIAAMRVSRLDGFELQLKSQQPITLKFRETRMKDAFAVISRLSGITFVFDPEVKDQNINIELEKATFYQAVDLLTGMLKLGHKLLNESTVLIYSRSPEKTKQYEDLQLRTIHLNHLDAKKAANLVRTMVQVKRLYINQEANALVVRDTREVADVVEKIIEANDLPEAEVVLDVEVIEISDRDSKNVGLLLSNYDVQLGAFTPDNQLLAPNLFPASDAKAPVNYSQLLKAFSINRFGGYVTVPNAQYNFGKTLANGEVLSNPKIRVRNREKAKFNVGTRVPITTATMATTGTLSQTNVQYVDVGIKVNAEPTIQLNNEVVIKLGLEVSSIISRETVGGKDSPTTVVTIGTRNLDTVLSLKDGETSVIGGLISRTSSDSTKKIFLLGDIPVLGPLISNNETSKDKTELILAITPRLVRGVTVSGHRLKSFNSGREDTPSLKPPYGSFELEAGYADPATTPSTTTEIDNRAKELPLPVIQAQPLVVRQPANAQEPQTPVPQQLTPRTAAPRIPVAAPQQEGEQPTTDEPEKEEGDQATESTVSPAATQEQLPAATGTPTGF